jgi:hypothetical protein
LRGYRFLLRLKTGLVDISGFEFDINLPISRRVDKLRIRKEIPNSKLKIPNSFLNL